jgi:hypothetical protein
MKHEKQKNLTLLVISAAILVTVNLGVWMAARHGAIAPIGDHFLWTAFAALNVVSLIWAIGLLGLHPLIVALSYVAGGFLAFKGVQGISGLHVAELTTAGSTYGAFGALVIGNYTAKVRLDFFSKKQVPFIFIIVALLVFDAVLNSGISSAGGSVILNAVVFPFVLAGVIIGLVWSVLHRYDIGRKIELSPVTVVAEHPVAVEEVEEVEETNTLKIQIPVDAVEEEDVDAVAAVMEPVELPEEVESPIEESVKPMVAKEEEFFPLEIDKDNDFVHQEETHYDVAEMVAELDSFDEEPYSLPVVDASLYASADEVEDTHGALPEEESVVALSMNLDALEAVTEQSETAPIPEVQQPEPTVTKSAKPADWLSGHLDLLNKLK